MAGMLGNRRRIRVLLPKLQKATTENNKRLKIFQNKTAWDYSALQNWKLVTLFLPKKSIWFHWNFCPCPQLNLLLSNSDHTKFVCFHWKLQNWICHSLSLFLSPKFLCYCQMYIWFHWNCSLSFLSLSKVNLLLKNSNHTKFIRFNRFNIANIYLMNVMCLDWLLPVLF